MIDGLTEVIVERILKDYYNEIQDVFQMWLCEEIDTSEVDDYLDNIDYCYVNKVIRELKDGGTRAN